MRDLYTAGESALEALVRGSTLEGIRDLDLDEMMRHQREGLKQFPIWRRAEELWGTRCYYLLLKTMQLVLQWKSSNKRRRATEKSLTHAVELAGAIFPRDLRVRQFIPMGCEIVEDYLLLRGQCRKPFERRWIVCCALFHMVTLLLRCGFQMVSGLFGKALVKAFGLAAVGYVVGQIRKFTWW